MKLPALALATAFAAGILLAHSFLLPPMRPVVWLVLVFAALLDGGELLRRRRERLAWAAALLAWFFLGALALRLEQVAERPDNAAALAVAGKLDLSEPLRWRGRLREDPIRTGWGNRYEIELEGVEVAGKSVPVSGELRTSLYRRKQGAEDAARSLPALHAGDRVEALLRARVPRNFGNPGAFDFRAYLAREGIHLTGSLRSPELLQKIDSPRPAFAHRLARLRERLLERLDALFAGAPGRAAVLRAMLLGDRDFIEREQVLDFQKSAVYHVLVIAGLHVGALAAFLLWTGRRLHFSLGMTTIFMLSVLAAYVAIVENRPPILRAALMAAVFLCSRLLFRRVELLNTTAVAAFVLLAVRPSTLLDPSFQLSFLAVGAIAALALPWMDRTSGPYLRALEHLGDVSRDAAHSPRAAQFRLDLRAAAGWLATRAPNRLSRWCGSVVALPCAGALRLWDVFVMSAAIQLGMFPLLAHYFHRVTLAGPLANIPAVLLTGLIVPLGFLALGVGSVWAALGVLFAKIVGTLVGALVAVVAGFAHWGRLSYRIPGPPRWEMLVFFAVLILLAWAARRGKRWGQLAAAVPLAALVLGVATFPFAPRLERGNLEVTVLDVGQGDSIFVAYPDGRTMLIDGGGTYGASRIGGQRTGLDVGEEVVSPYLWSRGLKRLDVVALTHAHTDHLDGLEAVLENFRVGELWVGHDVATAGFRRLLECAQARGVRVVHHVRGESFNEDGVSGRFLWPDSASESRTASNNDSLVVRLEYGHEALLLPGDIERPVERMLAAENQPLAADFLKVAHHGSRTSTGAEWVEKVVPRVAAVSVGELNPFGHPSAEVLDRLQAGHVRVWRTDRDGAITVLSDGQGLRVSSFFGGAAR